MSEVHFAVVGLGASAGGIKPLQEFLSLVPADADIAWVVILHLSPDHDSRLAEVLQPATSIPVSQVTGRTAIQPNHVYVVPPNKSLEIMDHALAVKELNRLEQRRAPIDVFFRTLAETHDGRAGCVVLSGSGSDGTSGLKRIKERGGLAVAQIPGEAEYPAMPTSAVATGLVDLVLPVAEMPQRIVHYFKSVRRIAPAVATVDVSLNPAGIREILVLLRTRTGHDFSSYKPGTVHRRIERRLQMRGFASVAAYTAFLKDQPDEATALMKELLISVTNFFRDPDQWRALEQHVIPRLFSSKGPQDKLRVWVPGCATGEEAYSLAMLLSEQASSIDESPTIQVFGTDLDADAVAVAREGFYTGPEVADVSEERLRRFFLKEPAGYRVRRELRELVLFAHHNVIRDPPFSHLDVVSCRNLLIYLNKSIQERVLDTFHFALRAGGYLFLGTSESPDAASSLFVRTGGSAHIYESVGASTRLPRHLDERYTTPPRADAAAASGRAATISPAELHQRLLEQYCAPSVIVTDDYKVVHLSERAGRYLQVPAGEPSLELLQLVRAELQTDLRTALHESARERRVVEVCGVPVMLDDGAHVVDVSVRPALREGEQLRGYFLVMFREGDISEGVQPPIRTTPLSDADRSAYDELVRVKAHLRATVEQDDAKAKAAQAANEELQSVNEELTTVNQELKIKIEELGVTNNDFQNFINSTDIGTIFLDRAFRVKLFTAHAQKVFHLLDGDVGRPLWDITSQLVHDRIHEDVRRVLDTLQTIEREVQTRDGCCHLMRIRTYRTTDNRIDGVVLTFHDITARREAEMQVRRADERLRLLTESAVDHAIFTTTEDGTIESWNVGAERLFRYTAEDIVGQPVEILFTPEDRELNVPQRDRNIARRTGRAAEERYHVRKDGTRFYVSGTTTRLGEGGLGFAKIARDLTAQREAEEALRAAHRDLESRVRERTHELEAEKTLVTDLLRRIVSAQEDERSRIARDLHDSLGQQLTALRLSLERHDEQCALTDTDSGIKPALALIASVGAQIDFLARQLRPAALEDLGLTSALPRFVEAWSAHVGIAAEFRLGAFEAALLEPDVETTFYRIAQEALNNVAKHAHASRVDVMLSTRDGDAIMIIEDDGIGFDPLAGETNTRGIGLATMRERASLAGASLDIESEVGRGTSLYLRAPVKTS